MKNLLYLCLPLFLFTACKKDYAVERSIIINASDELVWTQVKYFKNWRNWSPWYASDSTMTMKYVGIDGELESSYSWVGEESGSGEITNTGVTEGEEIMYHTHFFEPWDSESDGYIRLAVVEGGTEVTWGFTGQIKGIASLFMDMDEMVGPDFEAGLDLLKNYVENEALKPPKLLVESVDLPATYYITIREELEITGLQTFFATSYEKLLETGIEMAGFPSALYYTWDLENMLTDVAAAIPVAEGTSVPEGINSFTIPATKALLVNYYGDYEGIGKAHELLETYMNAEEIEYLGPAIEIYVTDPMTEQDPNKWLTKVIYPVK